MTACIRFPSPSSAPQVSHQFVGPLVSDDVHNIPILADDLDVVISRLRMYDLALCNRILPRDDTPVEILNRDRPCGLSIHIETSPEPYSPTFSERRYKGWIHAFGKLSGPFHRITFSGHARLVDFKHLRDMVEVRCHDSSRLREILDHKAQTRYEAIKEIMRLKNRGDELLLSAEAQHHEAFLQYQQAILLDLLWNCNDMHPSGSDFWSNGHEIYDLHILACYCNMAIAYLTGDLGRPSSSNASQATNKAIVQDPLQLPADFGIALVESGDPEDDPYHYTEVYYVFGLIQIIFEGELLRLNEGHAIRQLQTVLDAMERWWEFHCRQAGYEDDWSIVDRMYTHATSLLHDPVFITINTNDAISASAARLRHSKVKDTANKMRDLLRGVSIAPVQWYVSPEQVPENFKEHLEAIAPAQPVGTRNLGEKTWATGGSYDDLTLREAVMFPST